MLKMLSLFSGIGGIDMAAKWAGIETVAFCEKDEFCQKVLQKHWPHVPIYSDIKELRGDQVGAVDIVTGGFPCQDLSIAGKKAGLVNECGEATRSGLWYEMLRIISETKPKWIVGENVAGLLSHNEGRTLDEIVKGMENSGYEVLPILSSACNAGAAFEGKRIFIIAKAKGIRYRGRTCQELYAIAGKLVTTKQERYQIWGEAERCIVQSIRTQEAIPEYLRSDYGLPDWMDRVRALGNVVVPQQIYPIFAAITQSTKGNTIFKQ